MPIPNRLKPLRPPQKKRVLMQALLEKLLDKIWDSQGCENVEITTLIQQWNSHACRPFEFYEFRDMHSHTDAQNFIRTAFSREQYVHDLSFEEVCNLVDFICKCEGPESDVDYALRLLEINFPNASTSDLIFWPNEWFSDQSMLQVEMTTIQIIGYLMEKSSRRLVGAPQIMLPYAIPQHSP